MLSPVPMKIIATMHSAFPAKFGIPRQSGLVDSLKSTVVFEPEYRNPDALRGLEGFSHLWLIWSFSKAVRPDWSPTVRPPRLGGNTRMGVFATRSPFRPNAIGLSCVKLERIELTGEGPVLHVTGADLVDGTPILDIKPYLAYCDSYPQAAGGWTDRVENTRLAVDFPPVHIYFFGGVGIKFQYHLVAPLFLGKGQRNLRLLLAVTNHLRLFGGAKTAQGTA